MRKILVSIITIISGLFIYSLGYSSQFDNYSSMVKKTTGEVGRPEVVVETRTKIIVIFAMENSMKKITYDKVTDSFEVQQIYKFKDSTNSPFHKEPYERLEDAVKQYERITSATN